MPLLLCFSFILSCAKTNEEEVLSAIREARYHLNSGDCSRAQDVLDDVDPDSDDANFVAVMSSAIACDAGYTDTKAIKNLTNVDTSSLAFLGSFAAFPTSNETAVDQTSYTKILEAIDYLVKADGGAAPSTSNRIQKFGKNKGNDLSMQLFLMSTVAMGKFFAFYGNTDSDGMKGAGSAGNGCIAHYVTDAQMNADIVADNGGANLWASCDSGTDGHVDIEQSAIGDTDYKRRMCEGVILINNIFDVLLNIDISSNSTVGNLDDIRTAIDDLYTSSFNLAASRPWGSGGTPIVNLKAVTSQSACEAFSQSDLEIFYLSTFEAFLQ